MNLKKSTFTHLSVGGGRKAQPARVRTLKLTELVGEKNLPCFVHAFNK